MPLAHFRLCFGFKKMQCVDSVTDVNTHNMGTCIATCTVWWWWHNYTRHNYVNVPVTGLVFTSTSTEGLTSSPNTAATAT